MWSEKSEPLPALPEAGEQWQERPPPPRGNPNEGGQMVGADDENGYPEVEADNTETTPRRNRSAVLIVVFESLRKTIRFSDFIITICRRQINSYSGRAMA
jgi:hypothetical protein